MCLLHTTNDTLTPKRPTTNIAQHSKLSPHFEQTEERTKREKKNQKWLPALPQTHGTHPVSELGSSCRADFAATHLFFVSPRLGTPLYRKFTRAAHTVNFRLFSCFFSAATCTLTVRLSRNEKKIFFRTELELRSELTGKCIGRHRLYILSIRAMGVCWCGAWKVQVAVVAIVFQEKFNGKVSFRHNLAGGWQVEGKISGGAEKNSNFVG